MNNNGLLLNIKNLSKGFPGVKALTSVDFDLKHGEIHGLMGENGAGKSTLIKVLTGIYQKDEGTILYDGKRFECHSPVDAPKYGISTVYQEINVIPALSVAENMYIGRQPLKYGRIDWKTMNKKAGEALNRLNVDIDVTREISSYSIAIQQMVVIARALDIQAKILILDEPTSSLDRSEVDKLFGVMRQLKNDGIGIIFITHFIDQVFEITDRITILRNGKCVSVNETESLPKVDLIAGMLGKKLVEFETVAQSTKSVSREEQNAATAEEFYKVTGMERKYFIHSIDLDIRKGEVLGLAGLLGSGRTETAKLLFGIDKPTKGEAHLYGRKVNISSPRKAIGNSFAFCPEDRRDEGVIPDLTVRENIIGAIQARQGIFRTLSRKAQEEIVQKYIDMLQIVTPSMEQRVKNLSGGNQQKVILARWLATNPEFLILDEPTRGIDVGVKADIQKLVINLSKQGMAVMFISSELEEVINCCSKVVVLRERKKVKELKGSEITEENIMHAIAHGE